MADENQKPIEGVEIVLCTFNRADLLTSTLESIARLIVPYDCLLRLIVVDNASTDRTPEVLEEFRRSGFTRRHEVLLLNEPKQGHTFARNRAVESLDSDLVLWTDDDVEVGARWLQRYVDFANGHRDAALFGAAIVPKFESPPPAWVTDNWSQLQGCFAARDLGDTAVELTADRLPYGANFAVRTAVQKQFLYDTTLGRRGDAVQGEDELEMMRRLLAAGHKGCWVPDAAVEHRAEAFRVSERYVRDYFVGQGRTMAAKGVAWKGSRRRLWWKSVGQHLMYRFTRQFAASQKVVVASDLQRVGGRDEPGRKQ